MALINKLNALGDLVREKTGKHTRIEVIRTETFVPGMIVSKTANATGFDSHEGKNPGGDIYDVVNIPGASGMRVNMAYQTFESIQKIAIASGEYNSSNFPSDATRYYTKSDGSRIEIANVELEFENTDTITFYWDGAGLDGNFLGYYAECIALDENGNEIGDTVIVTEEEVEVKNTMTLDEMATELSNVETGGGSVEELPAAEGSEF